MERIITLLGILLLVLAAVFYFTAIAGEALMLLVIIGAVLIGIGLITGR